MFAKLLNPAQVYLKTNSVGIICPNLANLFSS